MSFVCNGQSNHLRLMRAQGIHLNLKWREVFFLLDCPRSKNTHRSAKQLHRDSDRTLNSQLSVHYIQTIINIQLSHSNSWQSITFKLLEYYKQLLLSCSMICRSQRDVLAYVSVAVKIKPYFVTANCHICHAHT